MLWRGPCTDPPPWHGHCLRRFREKSDIRMIRRRLWAGLLGTMAWLSADANANDRVQSPPAQGFENLDRLEQRVAAFAGREGGVRDPRVDRRLRLSTCDALPELLRYGAGQTTVLVRCGGPKSWQIYVPEIGRAHV